MCFEFFDELATDLEAAALLVFRIVLDQETFTFWVKSWVQLNDDALDRQDA